MCYVVANVWISIFLMSVSEIRIIDCDWFFFFFKQKTAYEMRISDWSSDVCSSDLGRESRDGRRRGPHRARLARPPGAIAPLQRRGPVGDEIRRAPGREEVG